MLEIKNLTKLYNDQTILSNINLTFRSEGLYFITGKSGKGKTTLFNLIGKIDRDYQGEIRFDGMDIQAIKNYQGRYVSYLFQSPTLVNELGCSGNYQLPAIFNKVIAKAARNAILDKLAISQLGNCNVLKISGGQKSRVALMRTLMSNPRIILADEPTASLDHENALKVLDFLKAQAKERLVIVITHDHSLIDEDATGVVDLDTGATLPPVDQKPDFVELDQPAHKIGSLAIKWLRIDLRTNVKMVAGIVIALVTIMITAVVALGLKQEVNLELNQLFSTSSYSSRLKSQEAITLTALEPLQDDPDITHLYLLMDEYEFLGVALDGDVKENLIIPVNDPTKAKPVHFTGNDGVVVSKRLADRLDLQGDGLEDVYLYFSYHDVIKSLKVNVAGISQANEIVDSLYFNELEPVGMVADLFHEDVGSIEGSIVTIEGSDLSLEYLEKNHPDFQFKVLGASLKDQVNAMLDNINLALLLFSCLSLVASLFLVGEVVYLSVIKNRRNIGIFMTLGATSGDLARMIMIETTLLVTLGFVVACGYVFGLVALVNHLAVNTGEFNFVAKEFLVFDWSVALTVYLIMLGVSLLASLSPAIIASRQDVKKVLTTGREH